MSKLQSAVNLLANVFVNTCNQQLLVVQAYLINDLCKAANVVSGNVFYLQQLLKRLVYIPIPVIEGVSFISPSVQLGQVRN